MLDKLTVPEACFLVLCLFVIAAAVLGICWSFGKLCDAVAGFIQRKAREWR